MKNALKEFSQNLKIEFVTIMLCVIAPFLQLFLPDKFLKYFNWSIYFTQERLNGIATFFAITIGVYIAVVTVLATSEIGISKEMLRRKLDKPLINIIIAGMVENFISIGLAIFVPLNKFTRYFLGIFLLISLISFVKFIVLLVVIFKENLEQMAKAIDEEECYRNEMLTCLEEICKYLKKINNQ